MAFLETVHVLTWREGVDLAEHQKKAVEWMAEREQDNEGGILADDMGLGKTMTCMGIMMKIPRSCTLIIAPASVIYQWHEEVLKKTTWSADKIVLYHGQHRDHALGQALEFHRQHSHGSLLVLTTYDTMRSSGDQMRRIKWSRVILDEAQLIKGFGATFRAACGVPCTGPRWCVTGTPFNNRISDVEALCVFVDVAPFNSRQWWAKAAELPELVSLWRNKMMLRREKQASSCSPCTRPPLPQLLAGEQQTIVATTSSPKDGSNAISKSLVDNVEQGQIFAGGPVLPEKYVHVHIVQLSTRERNTYNKTAEKAADECLRAGFRMQDEPFRTFPWLLRLRQSCIHPCLWSARTTMKLHEGTNVSSKVAKIVAQCKTILQDSATDKIIVFSQWTRCLSVLEHFLHQSQLKTLRYDGTLTLKQRNDILKTFRSVSHPRRDEQDGKRRKTTELNHGTPRILMASLMCGGLGLNLTCASHVMFVDQWYNPAVEDQAVDRVHRIGQTKQVHVHHFRTENTIEEDIVRLQASKREAATRLLQKGEIVESSTGSAPMEHAKKMRADLGVIRTTSFNIIKPSNSVSAVALPAPNFGSKLGM